MTDHSQRQWIDLGVHPEACMTRPETCGAAGGAVSFWVMLVDTDYDEVGGIITSYAYAPGSSHSTGFGMGCYNRKVTQVYPWKSQLNINGRNRLLF